MTIIRDLSSNKKISTSGLHKREVRELEKIVQEKDNNFWTNGKIDRLAVILFIWTRNHKLRYEKLIRRKKLNNKLLGTFLTDFKNIRMCIKNLLFKLGYTEDSLIKIILPSENPIVINEETYSKSKISELYNILVCNPFMMALMSVKKNGSSYL